MYKLGGSGPKKIGKKIFQGKFFGGKIKIYFKWPKTYLYALSICSHGINNFFYTKKEKNCFFTEVGIFTLESLETEKSENSHISAYGSKLKKIKALSFLEL